MNNDPKYIHETSLGHIIDLWDAVTDIAKSGTDDLLDKLSNKGKHPMSNASSIAKAASNLTMVFPVLCSKNISIDTACMISKAIEKNTVSMLQRLFASWQVADGDVHSFQDYLAKFHSNISSRVANLDDVFRAMDTISANESAEIDSNTKSILKNDVRYNINYPTPSPVNETSLNDYKVSESYNRVVVTEADRPDSVHHFFVDDKNGSLKRIVRDTVKAEMEPIADKMGASITMKARLDSEKIKNDRLAGNKNVADFFSKQVLDGDFKKANELMPTSMIVNFCIWDEKTGNEKVYDSAIAAVKAKLYPISSEDMVKHIADKTADRNWVTNFVRASTREISFIKDFVLAIDKAKMDALSFSERQKISDKMWKVLERRALVSKIARTLRKGDTASAAAITTLVISQEEVEYLRKEHNIDLERPGVVANLFASLNIMCVCIVDESLEVAKFIYDEDEPMWETISFTHLERDSSDNSYKKIVNLMTKMAR